MENDKENWHVKVYLDNGDIETIFKRGLTDMEYLRIAKGCSKEKRAFQEAINRLN
jgi:hypothetical protein